MTDLLSDEWLAQLAQRGAELPEVEGASMVCQYEIAEAPEGKVRFYLVWSNGRLVEAAKGKHKASDTMFAAKAADFVEVLDVTKEAEVAFMQGRLKVDGDYRRWLVDLVDWRTHPDLVALWKEMVRLTTS
jgi:predicted lipid carrier protein YhbT